MILNSKLKHSNQFCLLNTICRSVIHVLTSLIFTESERDGSIFHTFYIERSTKHTQCGVLPPLQRTHGNTTYYKWRQTMLCYQFKENMHTTLITYYQCFITFFCTFTIEDILIMEINNYLDNFSTYYYENCIVFHYLTSIKVACTRRLLISQRQKKLSWCDNCHHVSKFFNIFFLTNF